MSDLTTQRGDCPPPATGEAFACPKCGQSHDVRVLEDTTLERGHLYRDDDDETVRCSGYYTTEGWDEGATNQRLWCRYCCCEFPMPEGLEIDWV